MKSSSKFLLIIFSILLAFNFSAPTEVYAESIKKSITTIDEPLENSNIVDNSVLVRGWALNNSPLKEVKIYVDDIIDGFASLGISRPDVGAAYPDYVNSKVSGYAYTIDMSKYLEGNHKISVEAIAVDGTRDLVYKYVKRTIKKPLINIDGPVDGSYITKESVLVRGWALNPSALSQVKVYLNNSFLGYASIGESRRDVDAAYPGYPGGANCGFNYTIENSKLPEGRNSIRVEAIGIDGSKVANEKSFFTSRGERRAVIDEPTNNASISGNFLVKGWALNASGVRCVNIYADKNILGQANLNQDRPDVEKVFPNYPNSGKSGYSFNVDLSNIPPGSREIMIESIGNDGSSMAVSKIINVIKPQPLMNLDTLKDNDNVDRKKVNIGGWAINYSGVKYVKVYLDNNYIGDATTGYARNDVKAAYPNYIQAESSGFNYLLDMSNKTSGVHNLKIVSIGNDTSTKEICVNIINGKKLVVIDPGHNYGGDYGAERTINGVKYSETELNMQVAVKLQEKLVSMGYNVVMTRQPWDRFTDPMDVSLQKRTQLANDLNADLFVSIHHDVSDSNQTTAGVSTHYSSYRPSLDNDGIVPGTDPGGWSYDDLKIDTTPTIQAQLSKTLANNVVNALGSRLVYNNLKAHDHGLYVTRNINIPSILIECGFISNPQEAARCANQDEQQNKANVIGDEIKKLF